MSPTRALCGGDDLFGHRRALANRGGSAWIHPDHKSKEKKWTLLVGTLPIVFAIASRSNAGLPLGDQQRVELFVTAAQSVFAVAVLANRNMDRKEAWIILGLFGAQFVSSWVLTGQAEINSRIVVGAVYLVGAAWVFFHDRHPMERILRDGLTKPYAELANEPA